MRCCCGDLSLYEVLLWRPQFKRCCCIDLSLCGDVVETLVYAVLLWRL